MSDMERRLFEAEDNARKAAQYGQQLLEKVQHLQQVLHEVQQEKHELSLKLEAKVSLERAWQEEVEHLKETNWKADENAAIRIRALERENEVLKAQVDNLKSQELKQHDQIKALESQMLDMQATSDHNESVFAPDSPNVSSSRLLEADLAEAVACKGRLEQEVQHLKDSLTSCELNLTVECQKTRQLEMDLEEKECEVSSYYQKLEQTREEMQELEVEMEQLRLQHGKPNIKGNSVYSELDDRRNLVERQLDQFKAKYDRLKLEHEVTRQQLKKSKMYNLALQNEVNTVGSRRSLEQVRRLEELLNGEKNKTKMLMLRLEKLQKAQAEDQTNVAGKELSAGNSESSQGKGSSSLSFLEMLLKAEKARNTELQQELTLIMRQRVIDGDKMLEFSRKISSLESSISQQRAENHRLKMKLEEALDGKTSKGQGIIPKPMKMKYEDVRFTTDKGEDSDDTNMLVKDLARLQTLVKDGEENRDPHENIKVDLDMKKSSKKKAVSISCTTETVGEDGESRPGEVNFDENKEKMAKAKSRERKFNPVIYADEETKKMEEEGCKQQ